jgi:mono/diheme cytochrome c family protein
MRQKYRLFALFMGMLASGLLAAQEPEVKAGADRFLSMCAVCHGLDGRGGGPYRNLLVVPPADLTMLSENNGGRFPEQIVRAVIDGRELAVHGRRDMPIWGKVFQEEHPGVDNEAYVRQHIKELIAYLRTIQR